MLSLLSLLFFSFFFSFLSSTAAAGAAAAAAVAASFAAFLAAFLASLSLSFPMASRYAVLESVTGDAYLRESRESERGDEERRRFV